MRDHREGMDPTPKMIDMAEFKEKVAIVRRATARRQPRVTHTGRTTVGKNTTAARLLRSQR